MANQNDYFFKRTDTFISKEISLDHLDLKILALIEQNKSAREIGQELDISSALLKLKITSLHKNKIIKLVENYECMDKAFTELILKELLVMVGPMGSMILEDILDDMKLEADNIPKIIAKDLIRMIAKEIPDPDDSRKFIEKLTEKLT